MIERNYASNLDSVSFYLDKVYDQALDLNYYDIAEKSFYNKSLYIRRNSPRQAIEHLNGYKSLPFQVSEEVEMQILIRMAASMIEINDFENALEALKKADSIFETGSYKNKGPLLLSFGELYYGLEHLEKASDYYLLAYDEFTKYGINTTAKMVLYFYLDINKAKVHEEPYLSYYEKFIKKVDSSYLNISDKHQSISLFNDTPPEEKIDQLQLLIENLELKESTISVFEVAEELVETFRKMGNQEKALEIATLYLSKARSRNLAFKELRFNFIISNIYNEENQYKEALRYYQRTTHLKDSLNSLERNKNLDKLLVEFDSFKKDTEIAKEKSQNKLLWIGLALTVIVITLTVLGFMRRMKKNRIIRAQEGKIQDQKIEQLELDKKLLSMSAMIEGQEAERIRIAKDLHDGLGGLLATVKLHFGKVQQEINNLENLKLFNNALFMMDNACDEVRRISHNLMPPVLGSKGLGEALKNLVANLNETQEIQFTLTIQDYKNRLKDTQEMFAFRIVQELINNIIKHSQAQKSEIQLLDLGDSIQLIIEDDGIGFDAQKEYNGMGLKSLTSRVKFLQGHMEFDSAPGSGTAVFITLPKQIKNV